LIAAAPFGARNHAVAVDVHPAKPHLPISRLTLSLRSLRGSEGTQAEQYRCHHA
jgi:hypothetical protein